MTDSERLDSFLNEFRDLENKLAELAGAKDGFSSYSRSLQTIYQSKRNPILRAGDNFAFLKSCGELRNLCTHNNDVCYPTQECYERFMDLSKRIRFPKRAIDIATSGKKLLTATLDTPVLDLARSMLKKGLSHVPVLDGERLVGVFSATTLFDRFSAAGNLSLDGDSTVGDFLEHLDMDAHGSETFIFTTPDAVVFEFSSKVGAGHVKGKRRIAAALVTSDGSPTGKLMGIITAADLLKL